MSTRKASEPDGHRNKQARSLLASGGNWVERIERARKAREMGRQLRKGKPPITNYPRTFE